MIKEAKLGKEISITVANKIGVLADISEILADHGINIEAVAGYAAEKNEARIMLVTDDNLRAVDALKKKNYTFISEKEVIILQLANKPGVLKNVTRALAAQDINIQYIYGTTCVCSGPTMMVVSTSDNEKALLEFKKK